MDALRDRLVVWLGLAAVLLALAPTPSPRSLAATLQQARLAWAAGVPAGAAADLQRALEQEPRLGAGLHLVSARAALAQADWAGAEEELARAEALGAAPHSVRCLRMEVLVRRGDSTSEELASLSGWSSCEWDGTALQAAAQFAEGRGDWPAAREIAETHALRNPEDDSALVDLALLLAVEDPAAAIPLLDEALTRTTSDVAAAVNEALRSSSAGGADRFARLGLALARHGEWRLAERSLSHAVAARPDFASAWAYLGLARDQTGGDGGPDLLRAIALSPSSASVHSLLGRHWQQAGDLAAARSEFEIAVRLDSRDPASAAQLGEVHAQLGELEAAKAWFREAVDRAPLNGNFWLLLAQFSLQHEVEIEELGLPAARTAARLIPQEAAAWDALAYGHSLSGEFELSDRLFRLALALDPSRAATHYHLGTVFHLEGMADLARREWTAALELDPQGAYGILARRALGAP